MAGILVWVLLHFGVCLECGGYRFGGLGGFLGFGLDAV